MSRVCPDPRVPGFRLEGLFWCLAGTVGTHKTSEASIHREEFKLQWNLAAPDRMIGSTK
jgi:hypothetical protein